MPVRRLAVVFMFLPATSLVAYAAEAPYHLIREIPLGGEDVFEAQTGTVVTTIDLGAKPEAVVEDRPTNRLFVNLEDTSEIAVLRRRSMSVVPVVKAQRIGYSRRV